MPWAVPLGHLAVSPALPGGVGHVTFSGMIPGASQQGHPGSDPILIPSSGRGEVSWVWRALSQGCFPGWQGPPQPGQAGTRQGHPWDVWDSSQAVLPALRSLLLVVEAPTLPFLLMGAVAGWG